MVATTICPSLKTQETLQANRRTYKRFFVKVKGFLAKCKGARKGDRVRKDSPQDGEGIGDGYSRAVVLTRGRESTYHTSMKLGKKPAVFSPKLLRFADYSLDSLPTPPAEFGHEQDIVYHVLGNDMYGDCVLAGGAHETMLWNHERGVRVPFSAKCVLSDYSAITGFDPNDPSTDQGTYVSEALTYRKNTGLVDYNGLRHKIGAYVALDIENFTEVLQAIYLFGAVGIGFNFPQSAMDQWNEGRLWHCLDPKEDNPILGGHYVPLVGWRNGRLVCVTWGLRHQMTKGFFTKYCDEAYVMLSTEMLLNGTTPEGFNLTQLRADLSALAQ